MNKNDYIIRLEKPADYYEVENLTREAFWNVYRPGCLEHYIVHCYRDKKDFIPELDFVMEKDGKIIGHIMYVHSKIEADNSKTIAIMTFGPISIHPDYKRKGYGKALLDYSMEKAKELGAKVICIEGNIDFYGKSGFVIASTKGIHYYAVPRNEEVPYFLLKELEPGFLDNITGIYHTPEHYFVDEKEVEKFDTQFPTKQKLKLPGQLI